MLDSLNKYCSEAKDLKDVKDAMNKIQKLRAQMKNPLAEDSKKDAHHVKSIKPLPKRKKDSEVPLLDCFFAPCEEGCPIHQDITTYVKLAAKRVCNEENNNI